MTDLIRPLKLESPSLGGDETDFLPTEANPIEDYAALKGVAFNGDENFVIEHVGRTLAQKEPFTTFTISYLGNGEVDYIEYFNSSNKIQANRIYRIDMTYDGSLNPTTETVTIYENDGVSVAKTQTHIYSYSASEIDSGTVAT